MKLFEKLGKISNYDVFSNVNAFFIYERKIYSCPHIAESAGPALPVSPNVPNIVEFFKKKISGNIDPPLYNIEIKAVKSEQCDKKAPICRYFSRYLLSKKRWILSD